MSLRAANVVDIRHVGLTAASTCAAARMSWASAGTTRWSQPSRERPDAAIAGDTLALTPPLIVSEDQIGEIVEKVASHPRVA